MSDITPNNSAAPQTPYVNRASGAAVAFIIFSVILVGSGLIARFCIRTPAIDADRGEERAKALADIRAAEDKALTTAGWVDQDRKIVRLPIDVAIQLAAQQWQNPAKARADLIARGEKATAPLPKVAPKPSAFE